jgi:hypothetical protein
MMYHNFSNCRKTKYNPKVYVLPFSLFSVLINISQRFAALRSGGIYSTALDAKNHSSNIAKSVKRSTKPRLTQNRCWQ